MVTYLYCKINRNWYNLYLVPSTCLSVRIRINDHQYFDNVPLAAWNLHIGGYRPAQKWLKDRKGRTLAYDDITHYQRMIVALTMTDAIMGQIDGL